MLYKMSIFSFLICLTFGCSNRVVVPKKIDPKYEKAFLILLNDVKKNNDEFDIPNKLRVSEEIINFKNLSFYFKEEIFQYSNLGEENFFFDSDVVISQNEELEQLSTKMKSDNYVFFSNEKGGLFFAEIFINLNKKNIKYNERPNFGSSYAYLFSIKNGMVELVKRKELSYG